MSQYIFVCSYLKSGYRLLLASPLPVLLVQLSSLYIGGTVKLVIQCSVLVHKQSCALVHELVNFKLNISITTSKLPIHQYSNIMYITYTMYAMYVCVSVCQVPTYVRMYIWYLYMYTQPFTFLINSFTKNFEYTVHEM